MVDDLAHLSSAVNQQFSAQGPFAFCDSFGSAACIERYLGAGHDAHLYVSQKCRIYVALDRAIGTNMNVSAITRASYGERNGGGPRDRTANAQREGLQDGGRPREWALVSLARRHDAEIDASVARRDFWINMRRTHRRDDAQIAPIARRTNRLRSVMRKRVRHFDPTRPSCTLGAARAASIHRPLQRAVQRHSLARRSVVMMRRSTALAPKRDDCDCESNPDDAAIFRKERRTCHAPLGTEVRL